MVFISQGTPLGEARAKELLTRDRSSPPERRGYICQIGVTAAPPCTWLAVRGARTRSSALYYYLDIVDNTIN